MNPFQFKVKMFMHTTNIVFLFLFYCEKENNFHVLFVDQV